MEKANASEQIGAVVSRGAFHGEHAEAHGHYVVECRGPDGKVKWVDTIENLVTTVGKNFALDTVMAGSAYTAAWYMGLISSVGYSAVAAADTMSSHAGWTEAGPTNAPNYTEGTRPAAAWSAAAAGSKAMSSPRTFSINATGTVKGCFLTTGSAKDGTTGTLYSAGLFSGGDKVLGSGDTLSVSYTASL